jgi:hypothetical protein
MQPVANRVTACGLAALLGLGASRSAAAQMAAPIRVADAVTSNGVWVPGFWDLQGNPATAPHGGWVWVPGRRLTPPVPDARWDPGHWDFYQGWYSWIPAHWVVPGRHGYPPQLQSDESTEVEMSAP